MKLEQLIYRFIEDKVGKQKDIKGANVETLSNMKRGKSGMTTHTLKKILLDNDIQGSITLAYENTTTTIEIK